MEKLYIMLKGFGGAGLCEVVQQVPDQGQLEDIGKLIIQAIIAICTIISLLKKKKEK